MATSQGSIWLGREWEVGSGGIGGWDAEGRKRTTSCPLPTPLYRGGHRELAQGEKGGGAPPKGLPSRSKLR